MGFAEIVGHDRTIADLRLAYQRGRIPNAYLFLGPEGVGKRTTGLILSRLINCEGPRTEPDPCDICASCRKITHNNHTDVWTIAPEKSTLKIEQIRHMQRMVRYPPQEARMRVVIVDGVERMNREAANAFLKVLEEPPPNNLFLLICNTASQLLPTIVSRCQRVGFGPIARPVLEALLIERHGVDPLHARLASGISEGSVGKALQLNEHLLGPERREFLQALPRLLVPGAGAMEALALAEQVSRMPEQISLYLDQLRIWLRDLLLIREVHDVSERLVNQDLLPVLQEHAQKITTEQIYKGAHAVEYAVFSLRRNAAPLLTLERLFLALGGQTS